RRAVHGHSLAWRGARLVSLVVRHHVHGHRRQHQPNHQPGAPGLMKRPAPRGMMVLVAIPVLTVLVLCHDFTTLWFGWLRAGLKSTSRRRASHRQVALTQGPLVLAQACMPRPADLRSIGAGDNSARRRSAVKQDPGEGGSLAYADVIVVGAGLAGLCAAGQ